MTPTEFHEFLLRLSIEAYDRTWPRAADQYESARRTKFCAEAHERMAQAAQVYACAIKDAGRA